MRPTGRCRPLRYFGVIRLAVHLVALSFWAVGCGEPSPAQPPDRSPPPGATDLLGRLEVARLRAERSTTELHPARNTTTFDGGWRQLPRLGDCEPCVLGVGERSTLELFVARARPLVLRLRCGAYELPEGGRRFVEVGVGPTRVGKLLLQRQRLEFEIEIPAAALRRGANTVSFTYRGQLNEPRRKGGDPDQPGQQMICSEIRWDGLADAGDPRRTEQGGLRLPAGTAVDFWLDLETSARLLLRGVRREQASLLVEFQPDRGDALIVPVRIDDSAAAAGAEIESPVVGVQRVSLYATGEAGQIDIAGLYVDRERRPPAAAPPAPTAAGPGSRPHVVVFLVDTLRRDRLGAYGYGRPTSPHLDEFATQGVLFERSTAQAPWTKPTVASLFTGLEPSQHGVVQIASRLPADATTLAELLGDAGYQSAAFSGSVTITADTGFAQGFEHFEHFEGAEGTAGPDSPVVIERVERWLEARTDRRPLFLYVHTVDPHAPYAPPAEQRALLAPGVARAAIAPAELLPEVLDEVNALYDAEVALADASFGRFLGVLRRRGLYDDALVLFVADHGEQFFEHGGWRHRDLFGEVLDIPLVIKTPAALAVGPRTIARPVTQIDLLPTIADLVGLPTPPAVTGRSLLPALRGVEDTLRDRRVYGHVRRGRQTGWSVLDPPYKLIWRWENTHHERFLYNVERDPHERRDLATRLPVRRMYLEQLLRRERLHQEPILGHQQTRFDNARAAQLRALGYLD